MKSEVVKMVSSLEMVGFIKTNGTACRFVSVVSATVPKLKKSCPFVGVRKITRSTGLINVNYNTSVRRGVAEALGVKLENVEYTNGETWYSHVLSDDGKALPLAVNKTKQDGKYYLQYFPHKTVAKYVDANGTELSKETLAPHFYATSERTEWKPVVITISMENILQLKASGVIIEMPDLDEATAILTD